MSTAADVILIPTIPPGTLVRVYRDGRKPAWRTAAEEVERGIREGRYKVGQRLPSLRTLSRDLDVGHSTVQRVIAYLTSIGMVEAQQGVGVVVIATEGREPVTLAGTLADYAERLAALERVAAEVTDLRARVERIERGEPS
jgi:DNA-binding GntR family transcriptional regulator